MYYFIFNHAKSNYPILFSGTELQCNLQLLWLYDNYYNKKNIIISPNNTLCFEDFLTQLEADFIQMKMTYFKNITILKVAEHRYVSIFSDLTYNKNIKNRKINCKFSHTYFS